MVLICVTWSPFSFHFYCACLATQCNSYPSECSVLRWDPRGRIVRTHVSTWSSLVYVLMGLVQDAVMCATLNVRFR